MSLRSQSYDSYCGTRADEIIATTSFDSLHWPSGQKQKRSYRMLKVSGGMTNAFFHLIDPIRGVYVSDQQNTKFQYVPDSFRSGSKNEIQIPEKILPHLGSALVIGGMKNHWHFLINFLPRLELVRSRMAEVFSKIDYVVMHNAPAYQREFLEKLHPDVEFLYLPKVQNLAHRFDCLYYVDLPKNLYFSSEMLSITRSRVFDMFEKPSNARSQVFIDRNPSVPRRRLANRPKMLKIFEEHEIAPVFCEDYDMAGQVGLFHGADFVAGLHGAGMSNILFCRPGTPVLIVDYKWPSEMYGLALALGLRPMPLLAEIVPDEKVEPRLRDLRVTSKQMDAALTSLKHLAVKP